MKHLNITMIEDLRKFKVGDKFNLDFSDTDTIVLAGDNGAGKSTLINIIRNFQCDNIAEKHQDDWNAKLGYIDIQGFSKKANIDTNFKKFFFYSSEFDDPASLKNSASASAYIEWGGFGTRHHSNGQRNFSVLAKWFVENRDSFDEDTLIVFDEPDTGFDVIHQFGLLNLIKNIVETYHSKIIVITHNLACICNAKVVYDINLRLPMSGEDYLAIYTRHKVEITELK